MTARGVAQGDASTVPLLGGPYFGESEQGFGGLAWTSPRRMRRGRARPRRHRFRRTRRFLGLLMSLAMLSALVLGGLLLVTPGVSDAPAMARALDRAHHAAYPSEPVPSRFAASLVATEDHRSYSEPGIDPIAAARVILGYLTGEPGQGGATLDQQLAKVLYMPLRAGLLAKSEQVLLAIKLDLSYPQAKLLQMYVNVIYFGHGYYGLTAASCGYFAKRPAQLSWAQAALLAGLVQAPSADDPLSHLSNARAREAHVLGRLVATGRLTQAQAARAYRQRLHLAISRATDGADCTALPGT